MGLSVFAKCMDCWCCVEENLSEVRNIICCQPLGSDCCGWKTRLTHRWPSIMGHILLLLKCQARGIASVCSDVGSSRQSEGLGNLDSKRGLFKDWSDLLIGVGVKDNAPFYLVSQDIQDYLISQPLMSPLISLCRLCGRGRERGPHTHLPVCLDKWHVTGE